jgi:methylenetetrahydrofolate--tRNA-(uracil-5-)-methyltransferase
MKKNVNIFFAGQITGVEGYVESISSGFVAGINAAKLYEIYNKKEIGNFEITRKEILEELEKEKIRYSEYNVIGALANYISTENDRFQPMNANFGILPKLEVNIKEKKEKYQKMADRALEKLK